jgi:transcriptional regulator with XRE-family HTH domain
MKVTIKALRVNANLSLTEAAEKLHITPRTLQSWEKNITSPPAAQLVNICKVYGCGLNDISLPETLANSEGE